MDKFIGRTGSLLRLALQEDIGTGDLATEALRLHKVEGAARLVAKADGVMSGLDVCFAVYGLLHPAMQYAPRKRAGDTLRKGDTLAEIMGPFDVLLTGERTALNFLQHLSGVSTLTRQYVEALEGTGVRLLDTRKTAPGQRALEKCAVRDGGGTNHRMGLFDMAMIKDNHILAAGSITKAVQAAKAYIPAFTRIEVETTSLAQVEEALACQVEIIMLDNMPLELMREAVALIGHRAMTEASGNVTLSTIRAIASTGVDFISAGAITHSAPALDISMQIKPLHEA